MKPWSLPWMTPRWSASSIALTLRSNSEGSYSSRGSSSSTPISFEHLLVAPDRLVLHLHVGVEGDEGAVGEAGERVDLGEGHVVVALQLGEAGEHRSGAGELAAGQAAGRRDDLLRAEVRNGVEVGEVPAADVIGVLLGDLLDVDPAHVGEEHHRALGAAVPEHGGVVLLLDLGLRVDQDADRHVAVDLELEDLCGV